MMKSMEFENPAAGGTGSGASKQLAKLSKRLSRDSTGNENGLTQSLTGEGVTPETAESLSSPAIPATTGVSYAADTVSGVKIQDLKSYGAEMKSVDARRGNRKATFGRAMLQSRDIRSGNIFEEDPSSYTLYSTLTNERVKDKIKDLIKEMHQHAYSQQHQMKDEMTYEEILTGGILYPGEFLIEGLEPVRLPATEAATPSEHTPAPLLPSTTAQIFPRCVPNYRSNFPRCVLSQIAKMRLRTLEMHYSATELLGSPKETRFGIRIYLTNERLILVDAEPDNGSRMEERPERKGAGKFLTKNFYQFSYEIESELWYYPIPLADIKGIAMDVRTVTKSNVTLKVMRPWWSLVIVAAGVACWVYAFYRLLQDYSKADSAAISESEVSIAVVLVVFGGLIVSAGYAAFALYKSLKTGHFTPWQLQERQVRLGVFDPISQASAIFYCNMADDYNLRTAKDFIHYLQQNTPQLHYGSLAPAFVTSKLGLRSKMRNAGTETDDQQFKPLVLGHNTSPSAKDKDKGSGKSADARRARNNKAASAAPKVKQKPVECKLIFAEPVNCVLKVVLDANEDLHACTVKAKSQAIRAGIIPSTVQIRLAAHDVEGDRCIIASDMEMQVQLTRQRVDGTVRLFVWISPAADGELKKAV